MDVDEETDLKQHRDLDSFSVTIVPYVDWSSLTVLDDSDEVNYFLKHITEDQSLNSSSHGLDEETLKKRRDIISQQLSKYGLKTEEEGDNLLIGDALIIQPPYTQQFCDGTNEIILERVRKLLQTIELH